MSKIRHLIAIEVVQKGVLVSGDGTVPPLDVPLLLPPMETNLLFRHVIAAGIKGGGILSIRQGPCTVENHWQWQVSREESFLVRFFLFFSQSEKQVVSDRFPPSSPLTVSIDAVCGNVTGFWRLRSVSLNDTTLILRKPTKWP